MAKLVCWMPITALAAFGGEARAEPNILFILSDDTEYCDPCPYGGGEGRSMPTTSIIRGMFDAIDDRVPSER